MYIVSPRSSDFRSIDPHLNSSALPNLSAAITGERLRIIIVVQKRKIIIKITLTLYCDVTHRITFYSPGTGKGTEVKRPKREVGHSPPCSDEFKNDWILTSHG